MSRFNRLFLTTVLCLLPALEIFAASGLPAMTVQPAEGGGETYTLSLQILALMTALTLMPTVLLMMTSFTRIIIVLTILRQAMGTAQTPSNQILLGLALFLSFFVMSPVINSVYSDALEPYLNEEINEEQALAKAKDPIATFMLDQTRESDIAMFAEIAGYEDIQTPADTPFSILMPAFVTSELKTAFQIGFFIFIPFVVIDLVVASVLMAMGMMMLSPMIISLPFKIMLFVLIDGWSLLMGTLAASFYGIAP